MALISATFVGPRKSAALLVISEDKPVRTYPLNCCYISIYGAQYLDLSPIFFHKKHLAYSTIFKLEMPAWVLSL